MNSSSHLYYFFFAIPIISSILLLSGCTEKTHHQTHYVFGTLVEITIYDAPNSGPAIADVIEELRRMESNLHAWMPSELSQVNAAIQKEETPIAISRELEEILKDATRLSLETHEWFNPAIGNLIKLWGFHSESYEPIVPSSSDIQAILKAQPTMRDIHFQDGQLFCSNKMVSIDLGGYTKGLALDRAVNILKQHNIQHALINIGGNVMAMGRKGDQPWTVGIRDPNTQGAFATVHLYDGEAIGTSGNYQRFFKIDDQRFHHLINPRTGRPAQEISSVTIIVKKPPETGIASDVYTKPFFIEGQTAFDKWAKQLNIDKVLLITTDGKVITTPGMNNCLKFL